MARGGGVELREGLEQLGLVFFLDAGAAVGDAHFRHLHAVFLALGQADAHRALFRELDGVVEQVDEDLRQRAAVRVDDGGRLVRLAQLDFQRQALLLGQRAQGVGHLGHQFLAVHGFDRQGQLARLDLRHVEDVVDQREQVARAGADGVELLVLVGRQGAGQFHQQRAGEADDGVQWRAQFVRHVGDEGRLHAARLGQFQVFQGDFAVDGFQFGRMVRQAHVQFDHLAFARLQFAIDLHRLLIGGDQQVEDLLAFRIDEVLLVAQVQGDADFHILVLAQLLVHQHVADAVEQVVFRVRLADEIVGAAFDAADDVLRVVERGDEDHGNVAQGRIGLDGAAQVVAIHFRHDDIGQYQVRLALADGGQGQLAIRRHARVVVQRLDQAAQSLRLGRAVLDDQDLDFVRLDLVVGVHRPLLEFSIFDAGRSGRAISTSCDYIGFRSVKVTSK